MPARCSTDVPDMRGPWRPFPISRGTAHVAGAQAVLRGLFRAGDVTCPGGLSRDPRSAAQDSVAARAMVNKRATRSPLYFVPKRLLEDNGYYPW